MSLQAVLFDMDGVIVNTEPLHRKAWYDTFRDLEIPMTDELYESFTGKSTKNVVQELISKFDLTVSSQEIIKIKRTYFKDYFDHDTTFDLLPGVKDLIVNLHQNGVKLILASSASMATITWVFDKFNLHPYFLDKISGESLKESKPNPEIFIRAAELASTSRTHCIVIEDSTNGIQAAKDADIFTIAYKSKASKNQDYSRADRLVEEFNELSYDKMNQWLQN